MFKKGNQCAKGNPPNKTSFKKGCPSPPTAFKKGHIPWHKGLKGKGLVKPNSGSFQKGHPKPKNAYVFPKGKSHPMYGIHKSGKESPSWKGGKFKSRGYIYIYKPNHPFATQIGYVRRSRLIMEKHLGRHLTKKEIVHHLNGIKNDDRPENLKLFANNKEHMKFHHK